MTVLDTIHSRRSIRRYLPQPVPQDLIESILTAGIWAPSAHNRQPWRFVVVETPAVKDSLARAMGARLRADLEADHVPEAVIEKDVTRSHDRITSAPVVIVMCMTFEDMDSYPDKLRSRNEFVMATQSVAMAGQNVLLAAHAAGLGACWMCAPLFCPDVVGDTLDLPASWQPQGMITLGYPAQERKKTRDPLASCSLWR